MRFKKLFLWDLRFQAKYGFYFLYTVLTVIYVTVLFALPESWQEKAAAILIFSDPAAMGLFFMGAIVLLEKSQNTPCALAVSPVRASEYIIAKIGSLSVVSLVVAAVLALAAGVENLYMVLSGTLIASVIFTLSGIIVATRITSLNQFILWTVPVEAVCFVPAVLHLFQITPAWCGYYPANVCMDMISGHSSTVTGFFGVAALTVILLVLAVGSICRMWDSMGGGKL